MEKTYEPGQIDRRIQRVLGIPMLYSEEQLKLIRSRVLPGITTTGIPSGYIGATYDKYSNHVRSETD